MFGGVDARNLRRVFEVVGIGIAVCDLDGKVHANSMAGSLLGAQGPELRAWCQSHELTSHETGAAIPLEQQPLWRAFHHSESCEVLASVLDAMGHRMLLQISSWPLLDSDRNQVGATCVIQDVSSEYWTAEELAKAREEAMKTARIKSTFLGTMSHELRTPLCSILGNAEILKTCNLEEDDVDFVEAIVNGAHKLTEIVDDLLDYANLDAARLTLQEGDVEPRRLAQEICALFDAKAAAKNLRLRWACQDDVPWCLRCDSHRLRRVVGHLVGNAIKFTEAGQVELSLAGHGDDRAFHLELAVMDTGIGIHRADREHLFDPFVQADSSSTRRYGGTGLGLAICRDLVELMGGSIEVTSEIGRGSQFTVRLTLQPVAQTTQGEPAPIAPSRIRIASS